ncbi:M56 family metallopeptidase [Massilia horti]|uniref:M56 family peptidase n=1 Tax=Massilia horti TaxID=2562153 RepID=A0A4Y9T572_9BURK|nr:M56 family metallopeptidase [Massilia horti]TFW33111.1 M56 family peptidase [Massilia horti]
MNASVLVPAIGWTLVHFLWQGALIACATAIGLTVLRNARPHARYLLACSALLLCLVWPAIDLWVRLAETNSMGGAMTGAPAITYGPAVNTANLVGYFANKLGLIVALWAACALALALRMALGLLWIGRMAGRNANDRHWQARIDQMAARFGITRDVRLRVVDGLASPITAGWWRPVVLVPAALVSGMPPELLEALLAHELAHVRRFDYLVNLGQNVVETLLFYHPAVWWISNRIRTEREQIADDLAARMLGEPRRLALALSELERLQFSTHHLAQAANGGDLMSRIKRLVRPQTQALKWKAALPVVGLAALCIGLSACATAEKETQATLPDTGAVAKFSSCAKPVWPQEDLAANHEGTVTLQFLVDASGTAKDSRLVKSSGYRSLDEAAREGIAKCQFQPATKNGKPVEGWMQMQYVWVAH